MKTTIGIITDRYCPVCKNEFLVSSLYDLDDKDGETILICPNCDYQEWT